MINTDDAIIAEKHKILFLINKYTDSMWSAMFVFLLSISNTAVKITIADILNKTEKIISAHISFLKNLFII